MSRYLSILEVSQKQAYIFSSKKVKNNIVNSAVIAYVLSPEYIDEVLAGDGYSDEANMVYSGGGHTILEFNDDNMSKRMIEKLTESIYKDYDGLEVFAKTVVYNDQLSPKDNIKELTKALERKKSLRASSFKQGSYGIEAINSDTLDIKAIQDSKEKDYYEDGLSAPKRELWNRENKECIDRGFVPDGYTPVSKFGELGGSKNESNFIAVVHVDGNGMGKRVENIYEKLGNASWEDTKKKLREFSESIDKDFKDAYRDMIAVVAANLEKYGLDTKLGLKKSNFPVRRIITAGDDICFVTEGRIGVECARIFMEKLADANRKNTADGQNYASCAGVAIVHQKYPFYKAYELAEMLCSNAKRFGAKKSPADNGSSVSAIDWHIEFGEVKDSLDEIRKDYSTPDACRLELRPYIVTADSDVVTNNVARNYSNFRKVIMSIIAKEEAFGNGKIKGLRGALKKGEVSTRNYLEFYQMKSLLRAYKPTGEIGSEDLLKLFTGTDSEITAFTDIGEEQKHSFLFDAIELMDTYVALEGGIQ